jgi:gas vesicle protein
MERDGDFGAFLAGFVIGGLVGAAVALLLAPQSGTETRGIIRERSIELKDKAAEKAFEARSKAEELAAEARSKAEELATEARHRAEEIKLKGEEVYGSKISKLGRKTSTVDIPTEAPTSGEGASVEA